MTSVSLHPADSHQQGSRQTQRRPRWLKHTASALSCPGGLGDSVWSKPTVARRHFCCRFAMREFVKVKKEIFFLSSDPLTSQMQEDQQVLQELPPPPSVCINQALKLTRDGLSATVWSAAAERCVLSPGHRSLSPSHSVPSPVSPGEIRHVH